MMFSNYMILSSLFGLTINLYGNYILDRFKLENRFPRIAFIIKYRKKTSKYYVVINIILIATLCLINIMFGFSLLTILYVL
jgi:hypothetical protein